MVCDQCGRPLITGRCAGCRALTRICHLWQKVLKPPSDPEALSSIRNCEGALTDLAEIEVSAEGRYSERVPPGSAGDPVPPKGPGKKKVEEKKAAGAPAAPEKGLKKAEPEVKKEACEEEDLYEEGEESETQEEDEEPAEVRIEKKRAVEREKEPPKKEEEKRRRERPAEPATRSTPGGNPSQPLGLQRLPKELSPRETVEEEAQRKAVDAVRRSVQEKDASRRSNAEVGEGRSSAGGSGHLRPRSPDHPPTHRREVEKKDRSRSRKKKNKGKRKRDRGRDYWRSVDRGRYGK